MNALKVLVCLICFVFVAFAQASDERPNLPEGWTLEEQKPSDNRVETLIEQGVIPAPPAQVRDWKTDANTNFTPFVQGGNIVVPSTQQVVRPTAPAGPTAPVKP